MATLSLSSFFLQGLGVVHATLSPSARSLSLSLHLSFDRDMVKGFYPQHHALVCPDSCECQKVTCKPRLWELKRTGFPRQLDSEKENK